MTEYTTTGVDSKGGISRLAKIRKPQCTGVHEDFRIERNAENTLLSQPLSENHCVIPVLSIIPNARPCQARFF